MNTLLVQRPGTVTSTFVPSGILRGAAIVRPSTGTVPAAVSRGAVGPQQIWHRQYAEMLVAVTTRGTSFKDRHIRINRSITLCFDLQVIMKFNML